MARTLASTSAARPRRPLGRYAAIALAAHAALGVAGLAWTLHDSDPIRALERRRDALSSVLREPHPELARVERWRLVTTRGDSLEALWRPAPGDRASAWTVVMLAGIGTGERAALVVPPSLPIHVLAVQWPWRGPRRMSRTGFLVRLPAIREAILRAPATLAVGVEAVLREPVVDPDRVAVMGASLGVPPTLAALRLSDAPRAVILVDGAADLETLMDHELRRQDLPEWLAKPLAAIGFWLVRPLEPRFHAPAASGRPVLMSNARKDERLPPECVSSLHATLPRASARWRDTRHIRPSQEGAVAALAEETVAWLEGIEPVPYESSR